VRVWSLLELLQLMMQAGKWPVGLYPGWLRIALTFLIPVAFAVTVPAEALTGRLTASTMVLAFAIAIGMMIVSRLFWRYGLRHYSGASA
jgi:ABC-2 type transport system permease protein